MLLGILGYRTLFWVLMVLLTFRIIYLSFCDNERWEEFTYMEMIGFLYKNPGIGMKALKEDSLRCGKMVTDNVWNWTKKRIGIQ